VTDPTRSPIKDKPLRFPGQSLQEQRAELISGKLESWLLSAVFMLVLAGWEWFRYLLPVSPHPWVMTVAAIGVCVYVALRIYRLRPRLRALTQGAEGEKAVGQFLDRLREQGYSVFHDVLAEGFNVDHVLVGPGGVFTVETKTWSKPARGDARVSYDGTRLLVAGHVPERDPIAQAKSQARWIGDILMESTGHRLPVQPVVVFPGWFVDAAPGSQQAVWVMEPKGLPAFLSRQTQVLPAEDVKMAVFHLSRFIRSGERERGNR
jgi:Nuclease-related domain